MKRWIVVVLITIALIILASPGIIGRLAEKNIEENIDWADDENPSVSVTTERFDRGWFTSEGRHRVILDGGAFREVGELYTAETGNAALPSLIIDTRIDHGLLPVSSLSRDSGTLMPGLASTISTFSLDSGGNELEPLPGTLFSNVGLTGSSESRLLLESGSYQGSDWDAEWQGADLVIATDPASGGLAINGSTEAFSISQAGESIAFGPVTIDVEQSRGEFGFNIGSAKVRMDGMQVESITAPLSVGAVILDATNGISDSRMDAHSVFSVDEIVIPEFGNMDLATEMTIEGVDAASLSVITAAFKEAQASDNPELALQMLYPDIEDDMQRLIASGGTIRFDQFDLALPQGTLETAIDLDFAPLGKDVAFSWPAVLLAMTAKVDLRIPAEIYELAQTMYPETGTLVAMGVIIRDGDDYVMDAEYAQGLLNVNGAPMPIPMPGL